MPSFLEMMQAKSSSRNAQFEVALAKATLPSSGEKTKGSLCVYMCVCVCVCVRACACVCVCVVCENTSSYKPVSLFAAAQPMPRLVVVGRGGVGASDVLAHNVLRLHLRGHSVDLFDDAEHVLIRLSTQLLKSQYIVALHSTYTRVDFFEFACLRRVHL